MTDTLASQLAAAPAVPVQKGLVGRVIGVLTSPRDTYADIAARPAWIGLALVVLVATIVPMVALMSSGVGQRAALDQAMLTAEGFGRPVSDAQYQMFQRFVALAPYLVPVNVIVGWSVAALAIAGLTVGIFNGLLGDNATFRQVFAVVTGAGVVLALRTLFSTPLDYARETLSSPTTLNAVAPFFEDNTFPARLLGSIDLFLIWWMVNLAIGLGVLYKRRTAPIATTLLAVYAAIGLCVAIVRSMLSGA